ncbi:uncharacterized protein DUF4105 [Breznakibacter xylanolyticus]|uniref:Uncharacterized protein DUF4105 n=1 Tax=Breznakibacter xylanolyticus TaxID=990 RepID=A0A2W7NVT4_9BACT|nr:DUF4105 domain-containing protein [Breznakibacter xylanolyticus]PZX15342.1 uncharacterized protein DUF4105 [Breznakibacter xylanolyticus]
MNKIVLIGLVIWLMLLTSIHGSVKLSEQAHISLLTCSPGEELYSVFGHSALRVSDSETGHDWVFNYGTFDFSTSWFYLKFAHGNLNYMLSVGRFSHFMPGYMVENRRVEEQVLNLNAVERQRLFDALVANAAPENRDYRYDFFYDNCATRIRDMVIQAVGGKVLIDSVSDHSLSMRQLYGQYLQHSLWTEFGIHLLLGMKADVPATPYSEMYLPDYLSLQFSKMHFVRDSLTVPLVSSHSVLLEQTPAVTASNIDLSPRLLLSFFLLLVVGLSLAQWRLGWNLIVLDRFLFILTGMVGVLLAYLWFISCHTVTAYNFNLLWALPTNLVMGLMSRRCKGYTLLARIALVGTGLLGVFYVFVPQQFPGGLFLLVCAIAIRLFFYVGIVKRLR